jgi:hypothetical protein
MGSELEKLSGKIREVISGLDAIKVRRETFRKATKARFNIFTTLRKETEEVGLHENFLGLLLDAKGSHDCGDLFLKLFIQVLKEQGVDKCLGESKENNFFETCLKDEFDRIVPEMSISCNGNDYGRIDIGIFFKNSIIIIENKIDANEQCDQIFRYNEYLKQRPENNKAVIYLTKDGKESVTAGDKGKYFRISYSEHILKWLDRCLEKTYKWPNINTAIQQYRDVVANLVGKNTLAETNMSEMEELIKKHPDLIECAGEIKKAVEQVKNEYIDQFWASLKKELKHGEKDDDDEKTYKGIYLDRFLQIQDDKLKFYIQQNKENTEEKYFSYGIVLHNFDENEINRKYKSKFESVLNAFEQNEEYKEKITDVCPVWPLGKYKIVPDYKWYAKMINDESHTLKEEVKKAVDKLERYVKLVKEEWDKCINFNKES